MLQLSVSDRGFVQVPMKAIIWLDKVFCTYCDRYFACYLVYLLFSMHRPLEYSYGSGSVQSLSMLTGKSINQSELCVLKRLDGLQSYVS